MRLAACCLAFSTALSTGYVFCQSSTTSKFPVEPRKIILQKDPVGKPTVPLSPQEVLLLFAGNRADERALLTLNNNHVADLVVTATVYTALGQETVLPKFHLVGNESQLVELSPILEDAGLGRQEIGWLKLNYTGVFLGLGAQLTLYSSSDGVGIDSPRSLSADFKSQTRNTAFWIPEGGEARLALTNSSKGSIRVQLHCGLIAEDFIILSQKTKFRTIAIAELNNALAAPGMPASCDVTSDGATSALRAVGVVKGEHGYGTPIRFYDTATATSQSLTAVGIETSAEARVVVHNVTNEPIIFTPVLSEGTLEVPKKVKLEPRLLPPHSNLAVPLRRGLEELSSLGVPNATLTLLTEAPKGAVVGSLTQITNLMG